MNVRWRMERFNRTVTAFLDIHRFALSNGGREINESRLSFQLLALRMNDATRFHKLTYKTLVS